MKRRALEALTVGELLERAKRSPAARKFLESLTLYRVPLAVLEELERRRRARISQPSKRRTKQP